MFVFAAQMGFAQTFDISSINAAQFKSDDYIHAAISLQAMGKQAACQALLESAKTAAMMDGRYHMLCRMLFKQQGTNTFRPSRLGTGMYWLGKAGDWPLDPIAIVDGIPFCIGGGSFGGGGQTPQTPESYLNYCMTNCDWNTYKFHEVTAEQKRDALAKLLSSDKAKKPLNDFQKQFFSGQIQ